MHFGLRVTPLAVLALAFLPWSLAGPAHQPPRPPNIVFILTNDQDVESLAHMPRLQELLVQQGTTFRNMFVTYPLCCPSRVSFLTGQYPHNHGNLRNEPPLGGWEKFRNAGQEQSTLATWLHAAGYRNALFGQYIPGYRDAIHLPPGWEEWHAFLRANYFNYTLSANGRLERYGDAPAHYSTDVLAEQVIAFIEQAEANDEQPFFIYFAPFAPHGDDVPNGPATPAPRHADAFAGATAPRSPSFNEADVGDKPPPVARLPLLTPEQIRAIDHEHRTRLQSLLAVDEAIDRIIQALAERDELENTYIFFTSDNGYHLGQHRMPNGKDTPYEEDIRVPLVVRGPGVPRGVSLDHLVLNIDFAPTLAELAGATAAELIDGRTFAPLLRPDPPRGESWRRDFLVEIYRPIGVEIRALRTQEWVYVEYSPGARELYDLRADPYQLESLHRVAPAAQLAELSARLRQLAICARDSCR